MKIKFVVAMAVFALSLCAQAADNTKKTKLNELINVMDMDSMVESMYSQMEVMMQNMSTQMGVQPSEQAIFDEYYSQMTLVLKEDMSWAKMEPPIVDIYNRNFSEKEIDDMLAFYKTDSGRSLLKKMPIVMQESMQLSQTLMQDSIPKIQAIAKNLGEDLAKSRNAQ